MATINSSEELDLINEIFTYIRENNGINQDVLLDRVNGDKLMATRIRFLFLRHNIVTDPMKNGFLLLYNNIEGEELYAKDYFTTLYKTEKEAEQRQNKFDEKLDLELRKLRKWKIISFTALIVSIIGLILSIINTFKEPLIEFFFH